MRRSLFASLCLSVCLLLAPGCGQDPTAVLVHIRSADGAGILVPGDVDGLEVTVLAGGVQVWSRSFPLDGASRPLEETITFRPGPAADEDFRVEVGGTRGENLVATGTLDTFFAGAKVREGTVGLDWLETVCLDDDGDGHGKGPACAGADCDESDPAVHDSAAEACNGIDDDCDGATDEEEDLAPPRCDAYKGVCRLARKSCGGAAGWLACDAAAYGPDHQPDETACDELDNDCDGAIDEGCACVVGNQRDCRGPDEGVCSPGVQHCEESSATWDEACQGAVDPVAESCNQLDDDCDGATDEDFDLMTDDRHCGACDNPCGGGTSCQQGVCLPDCPDGWLPTTQGTTALCVTPLQGEATACDAYQACFDLGARVGFGGDDLPDPPPPQALDRLPGILWVEVEPACEGCDLEAHFVCYDAAGDWNGGTTFSCAPASCPATCQGCDPAACPGSNPACKQCGCTFPFWCYRTIN